MTLENLTDHEVALRLARELRSWRVEPRGAGMTQAELAARSGVGLTPLKRFEKTGGTTLNNLVAILRALNLLDGLERLVPKPDTPSPMDLLAADRGAPAQRERAPRAQRRVAHKRKKAKRHG